MMQDTLPTKTPVSFRRAFGFAKTAFKANPGLLVSAAFTLFVLWAVLEAIVILGQDVGVVMNVVAHLIFLLVFAGLHAGFFAICLKVHDGEAATYSDLFSRMSIAPAFFAAQVLYIVMIVVGFVVLLAPGFYLATRCVFFGFHLAEKGGGPIASLRRSIAVARGRVARLFGYLILLTLLNLLGASLLGIGFFVTAPISALTLASLYRQLRHV